jgi:glycosyltransferase involved in cell wall biosynthesis
MSNSKITKVLYVVESFSTGVYAIVRDIACNLDQDRFEVRILHSLRNDSPRNYENDFKQKNITLKYIPMGGLKSYLSSIRAIKQEMKDFNPDAIHLHSSKGGFLARLAMNKKKGVPVLYSPHGLSYLRTDVGPLKRWIFLQLEYWINKKVPSKIIAVSEGEKEQAVRISSNTIVINNFIDTDAIQSVKEEQEQYIVTTGRVAPQKNPTLFNEIALALPDYHFIWVGDGPLKEELTSPNITVTGYISRSEAVSYVKRAKLYLQTSLWEGMPVSILEAMAASKAVVASNIIGNRDLITNDKTGILCDVTMIEQFIEHITSLMEDDKRRAKLGDAASEYVKKHHSISSAVNRYSEEYQGIKI